MATGGEDARIRLWDAKTYESRAILEGHSDAITYLAFSPDGQILASASEDTTVWLWNMATGDELACIRGHRRTVHCVAFSPDGEKLYSASEDRSAKTWDLDSPDEPLAVFDNIEGNGIGRSHAVAPGPNGRVLAVTSNFVIYFLDLVEGKQTQLPLVHHNPVRSVAFSPDGQRFASAGDDGVIYIWDMNTRTVRFAYRAHTDRVYQLAFSPQGALLASASKDGTVRIWDTTGPQDRHRVPVDVRGRVLDIAFSPDGSSLAFSLLGPERSRAFLWDFASSSRIRVSDRPARSAFLALAFCPSGNQLALCAIDGQVEICDLHHQSLRKTFENGFRGLFDIAVAPEGNCLAVVEDSRDSGRLLDLATGEELVHLPGQRSVSFSPDGRLVALESANSQYAVELWDRMEEKTVATLPGHVGEIYEIVFSRDGRFLATASNDGTAKLWDVTEGKEYRTLRAHSGAVRDVAFHPDGRRVATAGEDGIVVLWDVGTGAALLHLPVAPGEAVYAVAFSPDGTILATGSTDGTTARLDLWRKSMATEKSVAPQ